LTVFTKLGFAGYTFALRMFERHSKHDKKSFITLDEWNDALNEPDFNIPLLELIDGLELPDTEITKKVIISNFKLNNT
jgi:hypothetical protein